VLLSCNACLQMLRWLLLRVYKVTAPAAAHSCCLVGSELLLRLILRLETHAVWFGFCGLGIIRY
jgi:hypothetical protein